ncbi:MAG: hypothetical protein A4E53_00063 [Pelotomaculum sp. PtaB.Bin104]|nr:MAG: hypothetical protein A4E53_00063 [Pelotomaculum sp. PtaB.Bin104]
MIVLKKRKFNILINQSKPKDIAIDALRVMCFAPKNLLNENCLTGSLNLNKILWRSSYPFNDKPAPMMLGEDRRKDFFAILASAVEERQ